MYKYILEGEYRLDQSKRETMPSGENMDEPHLF